mmetsp:Transcript_106816/g.299036  ORF Transcript_106816/g.299036 Transcript_106816/m.299036 type:complete len:549 (-) Transcript_106816:49-1695(-)
MSEASEDIPPPIMEEDPILAVDVQEMESSAFLTVYTLAAYGFVLVAIIGGAAYYFLGDKLFKKEKKKAAVEVDDIASSNTVGLQDITYLASVLSPTSTHLDILMAVASTPENITYGLKAYQRKEQVRKERIQEDLEEAKKKKASGPKATAPTDAMFSLDDEGWADDDDDDEKAKAAAKAEEEKQKEREQLQKAVGKEKVKLEGLDEGVIGQKWVENVLAGNGVWPPKDLGFLKGKTFDYEGKKVSALDHPGLRRNLCMITGRLNSVMLNSHQELLEAASKQLVDQTYFKGSMDFRGRCALLLEAALRTAVACRSYPLTKTIVETVAMFKIGTPSTDKIEWFNGVMQRQYQTLPRLKIENTSIECPDEKEMATKDILAIGLDMTRLHAEAFTRQKIAMFQKQGIPPQVALQTYREGWWFMARAERLDGDAPASALELKTDGILKECSKEDLEKFDKAPFEQRLLTAWPMVIQNVAQKSGRVKIQCQAPPVPGKYRFTVTIKSQDFLGADQDFSVEGAIVDASTVVRKPKEEKPELEGNKPEDPNAKKDN